MREHFVEWRNHLQERVDGRFSQPEVTPVVAPVEDSSDTGSIDPEGMEPEA